MQQDIELKKEARKILTDNCTQESIKRVRLKDKKKYAQLTNFLENLRRSTFTPEYILWHQYKIETIKWLIAYYEGRAACTPKQYLESLIAKVKVDEHLISTIDAIKLLYGWVYYKEIRGF